MFAAGDQLVPAQHAESLSAAELAGGGSASEEGSSEPDTSYDEDGHQTDANGFGPEMQDSRGKKRRQRDIGEGGSRQEAPKHAMRQTGVLIACPVGHLTRHVHP
jgi:hypothetical protein